MRQKPNTSALLVFCFVSLATLAGLMSGMPSSANLSQEDAGSEGLPITPAGSLIIDATTRQPAVGALPVDLVHSPDRNGRDGSGRYLIAVNSGFGIQFNAAGNLGQQSLSVIDLNASPARLVVQNVYFPSPQSVNVGPGVFAGSGRRRFLLPLFLGRLRKQDTEGSKSAHLPLSSLSRTTTTPWENW
jgi:hypothetical protein